MQIRMKLSKLLQKLFQAIVTEEEENKSYIICSSCDVRIVGTLLSAIKRIELKTALLGRPPGKLSSLFFISLHENMALPATMLPVESLYLCFLKILESFHSF